MYLENLKLWNFRKFGNGSDFDLEKPNLDLSFRNGLNVLIGENDSGKSAIIDAIKLVLRTHSYERIWATVDDFHVNTDRFRIELTFKELADKEAKNFIEWLGWEGEGENAKPYLRLIYDVKRRLDDNRILPSEVKAGVDSEGKVLDASAREYLKTTYLKPLRDAQAELVPKKYSRLSQILIGHELFRGEEKEHHLYKLFDGFNKEVEEYFRDSHTPTVGEKGADIPTGKPIKDEIDDYIQSFYDSGKETSFSVAEANLKSILEKLELIIRGEINPGLGTLNRLCMAAELLHLKKTNWDGLRLGLIEEIEAHLHPQAQMRVIEKLQEIEGIQLILTTHSPNLGSKVRLSNLIICHGGNAFPMGKEYTELHPDDYVFLERFLDTTKANLFFAKGVILVEGWSEELLLPTLAKRIGYNLTERGVSIVNLANTAFLRYSRVFRRKKEPSISIPVSVITDLDIKPEEENKPKNNSTEKLDKIKTLEEKYNGGPVKTFVSKRWTLEYCLLKSDKLGDEFKTVLKSIHSGTDWTDFEQELTRKLMSKYLKKTEIADQLAHRLEEIDDFTIPKDDTIYYLAEAIRYACGD